MRHRDLESLVVQQRRPLCWFNAIVVGLSPGRWWSLRDREFRGLLCQFTSEFFPDIMAVGHGMNRHKKNTSAVSFRNLTRSAASLRRRSETTAARACSCSNLLRAALRRLSVSNLSSSIAPSWLAFLCSCCSYGGIGTPNAISTHHRRAHVGGSHRFRNCFRCSYKQSAGVHIAMSGGLSIVSYRFVSLVVS